MECKKQKFYKNSLIRCCVPISIRKMYDMSQKCFYFAVAYKFDTWKEKNLL